MNPEPDDGHDDDPEPDDHDEDNGVEDMAMKKAAPLGAIPTMTVPPATGPAPVAPAGGNQADALGGGLMGQVLHTIFGPPESTLSPEEQSANQSDRSDAGGMSKSAAENPGESFMGIPSGGGGSLGDTLGKILSLFAKPG